MLEDLGGWRYLILSGCISIVAITFIGNLLTVISILTTKRLQVAVNCYIFSLALADFLVAFFVMPFAILFLINEGWMFGKTWCVIWVSFDVSLCTASILSLCAISLDRYSAVTDPIKYNRNKHCCLFVFLKVVFVWGLSFGITFPPIWLNSYSTGDNCSYSRDKTYVIFSSMVSFFMPFLTMVFVYVRIYLTVKGRFANLDCPISRRGSKNSVKSGTGGVKQNGAEPDVEKGLPEDEAVGSRANNRAAAPSNSRVFMSETKTAKTLAIVVGGFILCWLPFSVAYVAIAFLPENTIPTGLMWSFIWLGWANSAINPFIYAYGSSEFRNAFWRLTLRKLFGRNFCRPAGYNSRQSRQSAVRECAASQRPRSTAV